MVQDADELVSIHLVARVCAGIDAAMDNLAAMAAEDLNEKTAAAALAIREAGWNQVPWVDQQWPPMDEVIVITLSRRQWLSSLAELRKNVPIDEKLGDEQSAALGRLAITAISHHLG